ncbi:sensor histidine kinase [Sphingomonas sp. PAMC 26617]|uniref:sensor histidine kinase n=1 Tax=Sphingomonas sp. PAMC 26617 TaxID=1112216 RepID=UPI00028835AB|nr:ATP-binding protein [Sphingomonas sp. PAMC 26617]
MSFAAIKRWRRSSSARFATIFLLLYGAASISLFAFVHDRAIAHFNAQTDEWLARETVKLPATLPRADVIERVVRHNRADVHHLRPFGLFDSAGRRLSGAPAALPLDQPEGQAFEMANVTSRGEVDLRAMIVPLANGDRFLVAQDLRESRAFATDLVLTIIWGGLGLLVLGLSGSVLLALAQESRVRRLTQGLHAIMAGRLDARLTPSPRRDELDDLTLEVNRMLDEVQRLMLEVKAAGDNIAHDMRTPLTRLLANLRQADDGAASAPAMAVVIGDAVEEVTGMIGMFDALLRIAEMDEGARRQGFRMLDLSRVVADAADFHEVAALERGISITRRVPDDVVFEGDADLLFEAVGNLVDNSIKYTPEGGQIVISLEAGPILTVADDGPGIPAEERDKVLGRFHRVETSRSQPGNGLGLPLVAAIARVHRLELRIGDCAPGCVATLAAL